MRLPRRDRPERPDGRQREVALQRLARFRIMTGQGERRYKNRMRPRDVVRVDRDHLAKLFNRLVIILQPEIGQRLGPVPIGEPPIVGAQPNRPVEIFTSGLTSAERKRSDWPSLNPPRPSSTLQFPVSRRCRNGYDSSRRDGSRSFLRHPGPAQTLVYVLALSKEGGIVAEPAGTKAVDGVGWVDREPRRQRRLRLIEPTEIRQGCCEVEMRVRKISLDSDRSTQPGHGLLVAAEVELGDASRRQPIEGERITRTDAERLEDMGLGLLSVTDEELSHTDRCVSGG